MNGAKSWDAVVMQGYFRPEPQNQYLALSLWSIMYVEYKESLSVEFKTTCKYELHTYILNFRCLEF